ncbi:hypothetical protein M422DRAFT_23288 [Sphaerobolus stellatus SS14]|nr:hypothetical protein M422DRAFT_23288 [Sphaerobolus stellatus SS14]
MPDEFVVAQHDFAPEHDDEIDFKAGDLILIVEKDDLYGDGWWQGRNPSGKTGLFPQSYTKPWDGAANAPAEVHSPTALHTLDEEEESPVAAANISRPESTSEPPGNTVMFATLTDVEKAIQQLGVTRDTDTDAARSFSFASVDTETETEEEGDHDEGDAQEFRKALAERAERVNARKAQEQIEADKGTGTLGFLRRRSSSDIAIPPPIDVELSDESDADDEDEEAVKKRHEHEVHPIHHKYTASSSTARLTDESAATNTPRQPSSPIPPEATIVPPAIIAAPQPQTPTTATAPSFPLSLSPPSQPPFVRPSHIEELEAVVTSPAPDPRHAAQPSPSKVPLPMSPPPVSGLSTGTTIALIPTHDADTPKAVKQEVSPPQKAEDRIRTEQTPSPSPAPEPPVQVAIQAAARAATPAQVPAAEVLPTPSPAPVAAPAVMQDTFKQIHPSEWTVEQVVEWLKSKGIDDGTCSKFVEHEISGDVLLELDVSILKEELGITAFGKRMRIANAIIELKRPSSISSEPNPSPPISHVGGFSPLNGTPAVGGTNGHPGPHTNGNGMEYPYTYSHPASLNMTTNGGRIDEGSVSAFSGITEDALKVPKLRPAQLALSSPSEGALPIAQPTQILEEDDTQEITNGTTVDERGVQSETETPLSSSTFPSRRRRFLGLSTESSSSRGSKDRKSSEITSIPNSPALRDEKDSRKSPSLRPSASMEDTPSGGRHQKGKKSVDGTSEKSSTLRPIPKVSGGSERLSFFSATLGKGRKPAPRYSVYDDSVPSAAAIEKPPRSISRFITPSRKSARPGTAPAGVPLPFGSKDGSKDDTQLGSVREGNHSLLRKRNISTVGTPPTTPSKTTKEEVVDPIHATEANGSVHFEPGLSVLEQIGEPDHAGWLRKKGERYNTWKLRYLVLKGPHLYYLRSNSRTEIKIKGYIPVQGYKVIVDENLNPGKYGFRLVHETGPAHYFSSDEQFTVREWMKSLIKATIDRDYSKPVVSSCNIPTIPLTVAQAMNPAPRPPSPTQRDATQKALRRENPNQLSSRDARVLMGLPNGETNGVSLAVYNTYNVETAVGPAPPRPSRLAPTPVTPVTSSVNVNNGSVKNGPPGGIQTHKRGSASVDSRMDPASEAELIEWANTLLGEQYRIRDVTSDLTNGLLFFRLAEAITGRPTEPPVADSVFKDENNIEGMFKLFDYLLDNEVKVGGVSINDIKQGRVDKTLQLLKALRGWSEKRRSIAKSIGKSIGSAGPWVAMETGAVNW